MKAEKVPQGLRFALILSYFSYFAYSCQLDNDVIDDVSMRRHLKSNRAERVVWRERESEGKKCKNQTQSLEARSGETATV